MGLDRRFETRDLTLLKGPEARGNCVWIKWRVNYRSEGAPTRSIEGEETAPFEGDRICRLEDRWSPDMEKAVLDFMQANGDSIT